MAKVHLILKPSINIVMVLVWGIFAGFAAIVSRPYSYPAVLAGLIFGLFTGIIQSLAFKESKETLLNASTMMDVKRKLKNTKWGKRYTPLLWVGNIVIVSVAVNLQKGNIIAEIMAGYFSLIFARELITLKLTFELAELSKSRSQQ